MAKNSLQFFRDQNKKQNNRYFSGSSNEYRKDRYFFQGPVTSKNVSVTFWKNDLHHCTKGDKFLEYYILWDADAVRTFRHFPYIWTVCKDMLLVWGGGTGR